MRAAMGGNTATTVRGSTPVRPRVHAVGKVALRDAPPASIDGALHSGRPLTRGPAPRRSCGLIPRRDWRAG